MLGNAIMPRETLVYIEESIVEAPIPEIRGVISYWSSVTTEGNLQDLHAYVQ